jgi:hypothetical protein
VYSVTVGIFTNMILHAKRTLDKKPSIITRDKSIFSSERKLRKDYYRKSSVGEKSLVVNVKGLAPRQTDWR